MRVAKWDVNNLLQNSLLVCTCLHAWRHFYYSIDLTLVPHLPPRWLSEHGFPPPRSSRLHHQNFFCFPLVPWCWLLGPPLYSFLWYHPSTMVHIGGFLDLASCPAPYFLSSLWDHGLVAHICSRSLGVIRI